MRLVIRGGRDGIALEIDDSGVRIELGPEAISATVALDAGEARELAEAILLELVDRYETEGGQR